MFIDALERSPEERGAFLRDACGPDEPLRAEVESLLAEEHAVLVGIPSVFQESLYLDQALGMAQEEREDWLAALGEEHPTLRDRLRKLLNDYSRQGFVEGSPVPTMEYATLAGQTVGVYKVLSPIGQGGMGSVWLAERIDGRFERMVAIKFLSIALVGGAGPERFEREGRMLGRLAHPHVAELLDAGVSTTGQPYLVLEHVDGQHIDGHCDRHGLDVKGRVRLFLDVLAAVAHAHANLIVHRDIKPSNVLVRNDGQVKLLDFGIAKLLEGEAESGSPTPLTREQGGALTPAYAAPEQVTGEAITTATDVYGLGVLLYLLLTGQHPAGPSLESHAELVKAIVDVEPKRASEVVIGNSNRIDVTTAASNRATTPQNLRRLLRGDLDTILGKALKKNPHERYASASALSDDLRRYLTHQPIAARPDTISYRASKFVQRNRIAVAFAALALLAVSGGIAGTLMQAHTARAERDFAYRQLSRAESLNDFNQFLLSDGAPASKTFTVKELLESAEHILARQRATNENQVALLASIGFQYSIQDENVKARRLLEDVYRLSRGMQDPTIRAAGSCYLASALVRDGELDRAESLFQEGVRELPSEPQFAVARAECLRRGSEVAEERGAAREGVNRMKAALEVLRQSPYNSDWNEMLTLMDLGEAYRMAGQNYEASSVFEKVNALMLSLGRDETRTAGVLFNDWALALEKLGRPLEAQSLLRRSIDIQRGGEAEETVPAVLLNNYAGTLRTLGFLKEAADYAEKAYQKAERVGDQFTIHRSLLMLSSIYLDQRDFLRAKAMITQVEPILRREFSPDNMLFGSLASRKALLESESGNSEHALLFANQAVDILENSIKTKGQGADILPFILLSRAKVELEAVQPRRAEEDAVRSLGLLRAAIQPGALSSHIGNAYLTLGRALQAQGKTDNARSAFASAAEHFEKTLGPDNSYTRSAHELADSLAQRRTMGQL